jgi:hypothetical protein
MRGTVRVGFGIAVLFAAGVIVVAMFGNHDSWFVRAAGANAVHCLTEAPCARIDAGGTIVNAAPPPLTAASRCAKRSAWEEVPRLGIGKIVVICRDGGRAYLYHLGKLRRDVGGNEQWMACADPACTRELPDLVKLMRL